MSKATPWLLAGLAGILALLGGLALLAESPWARQLIERQLSQRLDGLAVSIGEFDIEWGLPLGVQLRDLRIANADWASDAPLLTLDALRARLGFGALLTGDVQLRSLQLVQPQVHLARQADGQTNWAALLGDGPEQGSLPFSPDPLRIRDGEIHYRDAQLGLQLDLSVATHPSDEGPHQLNVEGSGQFRGRPVSLTLIGDPPAQALAADAPYALSLNAQLGALQLQFEGQSASLPSLEQLQGRLTASASDAMAFDALPIDLPPFRLQASTRRDGSQWALSDIDLRTNGSHLTGAASVQAGSEPRVAIRLEGDQLDLDRWGLMPRPTRTGERRPMAADRLLGNASDLLERLGDYRGELSLQLDTLSYADNALQDVAIEAQLDGQHLELAQLHVKQGQGAVSLQGGFDWADAGLSGALDAQLDQFDLGQALAAFGQPGLGVLDGEIHLRLAPDTASIENTQLLYKAPQQDLRVQLSAASTTAGLALHGTAWHNRVPVQFDLQLGALPQLFQDATWPVEGVLRSGDARLTLDGHVTDPLQLDAAVLQVSLEGQQLDRLDTLTGLDLPALGDYRLDGELRWEDQQLRLLGLDARWGESDLSGDVRLSLAGRPMLWANLHADTLRWRDLRPTTERARDKRQLFSDRSLKLEALQGRDAIVRFSADNLVVRDVPLNAVTLKAILDEGVLEIEPLRLELAGGTAQGTVRLNTRVPRPSGTARLSLTGARFSPLLRRADFPSVAQDSAAVIGGQLRLAVSGQSAAEMAAGADGRLELAMSGGQLDKVAIELLGLDAGEASIAALINDAPTDMSCGYLRFDADAGIAHLERFFVSTQDSNLTGGGQIDLATERLKLAFDAHAKDFSLLSGQAPIQLRGTLRDPQVEVITDTLVARGLASVLGDIVAPPLAILPWLEPGFGEGSGMGCDKALKQFERTGT